VSTFHPIYTRFGDVRDGQAPEEGRLERWRRIVVEAAEQSGRVRLPHVEAARPFEDACVAPPLGVLALMPHVDEGGPRSLGGVERMA
jgi:RsmE family RNA methyltransferase